MPSRHATSANTKSSRHVFAAAMVPRPNWKAEDELEKKNSSPRPETTPPTSTTQPRSANLLMPEANRHTDMMATSSLTVMKCLRYKAESAPVE